MIALHVLQAGPCSQIDLAHSCHVRAQTMSRILDRLERDGHVARKPDAADRRRVLVRIVEELSSRPPASRPRGAAPARR